MTNSTDQERKSAFAACPDTGCDWGSFWKGWQARAAVQPASVAVPDAAGAVIKIAAALCTVALREIENAMDSPRLSRGRLENALAACKDRLGGYAIDLRCSAAPHPVSGEQKAERLSVWEGSMPESNGKTNYTAILHKGDISEGMTIASSEYPDRVRYKADEVRWLIGERDERPDILDYDADKHSGYTPPPKQAAQDVAGLVEALDKIVGCFPFGLNRHVFSINGGQPLQADGDTEFLSYKKVNAVAGLIRQLASDALAAHRAKQGEQP